MVVPEWGVPLLTEDDWGNLDFWRGNGDCSITDGVAGVVQGDRGCKFGGVLLVHC